MPASTEPAFGQVWRYRVGGQGGLWMLIAPKIDDIDLGYWFVLYMGRELIETRLRTGRTVIDQMAGIPGAAKKYVDAGWERVA